MTEEPCMMVERIATHSRRMDLRWSCFPLRMKESREYVVRKRDHIALKYVNTQTKLNSRHEKWVSFLQGYTFVSKHKSRKQKEVADALSRHAILLTTMENQVIGFDALKDIYPTDKDFQEIVA